MLSELSDRVVVLSADAGTFTPPSSFLLTRTAMILTRVGKQGSVCWSNRDLLFRMKIIDYIAGGRRRLPESSDLGQLPKSINLTCGGCNEGYVP